MANEVAVLGVGMHPWGKWGRNFVEYGVKAARDALKDAGLEWTDVEFVAGGDTMRNGYPGYVAGATFAQALGWSGAQVASTYGACATGAQAINTARAHNNETYRFSKPQRIGSDSDSVSNPMI